MLHKAGTMARCKCINAAAVALLWLSTAAAAAGRPEQCLGPSRFDPIVANSTFYGRPNMSDAVWHDDTWAHKQYGPISRLTLYKAWYYDGAWHDPGELKGVQAWHGRYYTTDETRLLFGAKRPHVPLNCTLYRSEVIVRAELQWDHIFRFMNFSTNLGRYCSWGFPDVENVTKAVVEAPGPSMYIAALRGYEGKPLPPSLGGFKKRYIVQMGFAWAQRTCGSNVTALRQQVAAAIAAAAHAQLPRSGRTRTGSPGVRATAAAPVAVPVIPLNAATQQAASQRQQQQLQQPGVGLLLTARNSSIAAITPATDVRQSYDPTVAGAARTAGVPPAPAAATPAAAVAAWTVAPATAPVNAAAVVTARPTPPVTPPAAPAPPATVAALPQATASAVLLQAAAVPAAAVVASPVVAHP